MPKDRNYTSYQKGIIRRYYDHKDDLMSQKLGEIVSELYICTEEKKAARLWKSARAALLNAGANEARVDCIVDARDLEALARIVGEIF